MAQEPAYARFILSEASTSGVLGFSTALFAKLRTSWSADLKAFLIAFSTVDEDAGLERSGGRVSSQ